MGRSSTRSNWKLLKHPEVLGTKSRDLDHLPQRKRSDHHAPLAPSLGRSANVCGSAVIWCGKPLQRWQLCMGASRRKQRAPWRGLGRGVVWAPPGFPSLLRSCTRSSRRSAYCPAPDSATMFSSKNTNNALCIADFLSPSRPGGLYLGTLLSPSQTFVTGQLALPRHALMRPDCPLLEAGGPKEDAEAALVEVPREVK